MATRVVGSGSVADRVVGVVAALVRADRVRHGRGCRRGRTVEREPAPLRRRAASRPRCPRRRVRRSGFAARAALGSVRADAASAHRYPGPTAAVVRGCVHVRDVGVVARSRGYVGCRSQRRGRRGRDESCDVVDVRDPRDRQARADRVVYRLDVDLPALVDGRVRRMSSRPPRTAALSSGPWATSRWARRS